MSLDAQIIDSVTNKVDPDFSVSLELQQHALLFGHPELRPEKFPLLWRISDFYKDVHYTTDELDGLIQELEHTASLFTTNRSVRSFTGPFHSLCCTALIRYKDVALYAD